MAGFAVVDAASAGTGGGFVGVDAVVAAAATGEGFVGVDAPAAAAETGGGFVGVDAAEVVFVGGTAGGPLRGMMVTAEAGTNMP